MNHGRRGASAIQCHRGYVVDRIPCAGGTCAVSPQPLYFGDRLTYCVTETPCEAQGARCTSGNRVEGCVGGWQVAMACNERTECEQFTVNPTEPMASWKTEAECVLR